MHAAKITRAAGDHDVVKIIRAAARVRHEMIVLDPHGLERGVLVNVSCAPW